MEFAFPDARPSRQAERRAMVAAQIEARGVRDERVLEIMRELPRELFVPEAISARAYDDDALPAERGQTISQPFIVARMTELLALRGGERVLEIGTGTGYQTAILAQLSGEVFTIEWVLPLLTSASSRLDQLGVRNVRYRCSDGTLGWREHAPFDAVLVTAGGPRVPEALRSQLAIGGRLVLPVGPPQDQTLARIVRRSPREFDREDVLACRFVKLLGSDGCA